MTHWWCPGWDSNPHDLNGHRIFLPLRLSSPHLKCVFEVWTMPLPCRMLLRFRHLPSSLYTFLDLFKPKLGSALPSTSIEKGSPNLTGSQQQFPGCWLKLISPACLPFHHPGRAQTNVRLVTGINKKSLQFLEGFGAENETRTRDLNLGKVALYQLSYFRICLFSKPLFRSAVQIYDHRFRTSKHFLKKK